MNNCVHINLTAQMKWTKYLQINKRILKMGKGHNEAVSREKQIHMIYKYAKVSCLTHNLKS